MKPINCHDLIEGGHQEIVRTYHKVKTDYWRIWMYADVVRDVQACDDCSTSKSNPALKGYLPGNMVFERPSQVVSMDFVIPLPKTRRWNTEHLRLQCHLTGFVTAMGLSDTSTLGVAKAFDENIFRHVGAPSIIRHDRDPRVMSECVQKFAYMMQVKSIATISYLPRAKGKQ